MSALANLKPDDRAYFEHAFDVIRKAYQFKSDQKAIENYIFEHDLEDFLIWVQQPIIDVFGDVEKQLRLFECWEENESQLVVTICSNIEDLDEMMQLENQFFVKIGNSAAIRKAMHHIIIEQN